MGTLMLHLRLAGSDNYGDANKANDAVGNKNNVSAWFGDSNTYWPC
jgi:hypothetical protein